MNKFLTFSAPLLLLAIQTPLNCIALHVQSDKRGEEYAVYAAAVGKLFAGNKVAFDTQSTVNLLVIRDHTVTEKHGFIMDGSDRHWRDFAPRLAPFYQNTVASFRARNQERYQLEDSFSLPIKHVLVRSEELDRVLKERRWEEFYEKYPESGGFISFSRVGFNPEMSQALVYFEHWCRAVCGSGIYVLLDKDGEGWKVTKVARAWIS